METIDKGAEIAASRCIEDEEDGEILEDGEIDEEEVVEAPTVEKIETETILEEEEVVVNEEEVVEEASEEEEDQRKHRKKSHHRRRKKRHDDERKSRHKKRKVCISLFEILILVQYLTYVMCFVVFLFCLLFFCACVTFSRLHFSKYGKLAFFEYPRLVLVLSFLNPKFSSILYFPLRNYCMVFFFQ